MFSTTHWHSTTPPSCPYLFLFLNSFYLSSNTFLLHLFISFNLGLTDFCPFSFWYGVFFWVYVISHMVWYWLLFIIGCWFGSSIFVYPPLYLYIGFLKTNSYNVYIVYFTFLIYIILNYNVSCQCPLFL